MAENDVDALVKALEGIDERAHRIANGGPVGNYTKGELRRFIRELRDRARTALARVNIEKERKVS